jgi:uncharacterized membrane protein
MIGYVYLSDVPKMIICIVIGIALMLIWMSILAYFFPHGGTAAAWLVGIGLVGTLGFSWWAGTNIWEWIEIRRIRLQNQESPKTRKRRMGHK